MSGDMCTSLGNGFTNLMLWLFLANTLGLVADGVVEGDDGLFVCRCAFGSNRGRSVVLAPETFEQLGFRAKLKFAGNVGEAGFCKLFFDDAGNTVADPAPILCGVGWTHSPLLRSGPIIMEQLLRAKGYSLLALFPNCPILTSFGRMIIRCVGDGKLRWDGEGGHADWWTFTSVLMNTNVNSINAKDMLKKACTIALSSRILMQKLFNVSVESQLELEAYFDHMTKIQELSHPALGAMMKDDWRVYYNSFVYSFSPEDSDTFPG
jgi:hypothetical protein